MGDRRSSIPDFSNNRGSLLVGDHHMYPGIDDYVDEFSPRYAMFVGTATAPIRQQAK
jgi:hypothetical protein